MERLDYLAWHWHLRLYPDQHFFVLFYYSWSILLDSLGMWCLELIWLGRWDEGKELLRSLGGSPQFTSSEWVTGWHVGQWMRSSAFTGIALASWRGSFDPAYSVLLTHDTRHE
jgi:hypothetical protein